VIGWLRGRVQTRVAPRVVLDVGGVGYELELSMRSFESLPAEGEEVELEVLTVFRAESLQLFGFGDLLEKQLFSILTSISGVGPKLALAVLSELGPAMLARAVGEEDETPLLRVSGVGRKTAQRLLLELRDKLGELDIDLCAAGPPRAAKRLSSPVAKDAVSALESLGFRPREAEEAVAKALDDQPTLELVELIRASLRGFGTH